MKMCLNLFNWFKAKKIKVMDIIAAVILIIGYLLYFAFFSNLNLDFNLNVKVQDGYLSKIDVNNNTYIIDSGKTRILKLENNKVKFEMKTSNANSFYQAENIALCDNGDFYVHGVYWDESGFLLASEKIIKYSYSGQVIDTLYNVDYKTEDEVNKHQLFDLNLVDGKIKFIKADKFGFELVNLSDNKEYSVQKRFDFLNAITFIQDFAVDKRTNTVFLADKRGEILCANENGIDTYRSFEDTMVTPFSLDVGSDGSVYFSDIHKPSINRIFPDKSVEEVVNESKLNLGGNNGALLNVTVNNVKLSDKKTDVISTIYDSEFVHSITSDGQVLISSSQFSQSNDYLAMEIIIYTILSLCAISIIYLILRIMLMLIFNKLKMKLIYKYELIIVLTTIIVISITLPMILPTIKSNYNDLLSDRLTVVSTIISNKINIKNLENINSPKDFMNSDYVEVINSLHESLTKNIPSEDRMGAQLEKYENGVGYAIAFPDLSIGSYYPLDKNSTVALQKIYETKQPLLSQVDNSAGSFIFARVPILDENENVIAVINVAKDSTILEQTIVDMIIKIIINLFLILIVGIFVLNEVVSYIIQRKKYIDKKIKSNDTPSLPYHIIKTSAFIFSASFNIPTTFLPVYTLLFYSDSLGIPKVLAGTLPLLINSAFLTLASPFFSILVRKFNVKYVTVFGALCSLCGNILLATSGLYYLMVIALLLNGLGFGLLDNSRYLYFTKVGENEQQKAITMCNSSGYAGAFCGLILGAFGATSFNLSQVFWGSVFIDLITLLLCIYLGKKIVISTKKKVTNKDNSKNNISAFKFLRSRNIWSYLLLLTVEFGIISGFVCYYVPIYGDNNGFNTKQISLILAVFTFCTAFLSVPLTATLSKILKKKSLYVSILLSLFAMIIIANFNSIYILIAGILFLGIAQSFGVNVFMTYFINDNSCQNYDKDKKSSIYKFAYGIGNAISSTIYGIIISTNIANSMWIFTGVIFVFMLIYRLFFDRCTKR